MKNVLTISSVNHIYILPFLSYFRETLDFKTLVMSFRRAIYVHTSIPQYSPLNKPKQTSSTRVLNDYKYVA